MDGSVIPYSHQELETFPIRPTALNHEASMAVIESHTNGEAAAWLCVATFYFFEKVVFLSG